MATEIERKFLVRGEDWRAAASHSVEISDGLLAASPAGKVRIRIMDGQATITVKGARRGLARDEFEYPIPLEDARQLVVSHCAGVILKKTRFYAPYRGFVWEVDVYHDLLDGVVLAEVELQRTDDVVPLPHWIGAEVTGVARWRKASLVAEARARSQVAPQPG